MSLQETILFVFGFNTHMRLLKTKQPLKRIEALEATTAAGYQGAD